MAGGSFASGIGRLASSTQAARADVGCIPVDDYGRETMPISAHGCGEGEERQKSGLGFDTDIWLPQIIGGRVEN
eukprot:1193043-Prorocentrum_minimum.AAC.3